MAIYVSNIVIEQGFDFDTTFVLEDTLTNDFLDLSGYVIESQLRKTYTSSTSVSFATIVTEPLNGTVTIALGSTITSTLKNGRYVYDVKATTGGGGGSVIKLVEGVALVRPGVTR
jgi:hypothetical protein